MSATLERDAVVTVRFDPAEGSEICKTRPAVVVSNSAACRFDSVIQVVPVTRLPERALRPYEAAAGSPLTGLAKPSRLVANQIRTISKGRIGKVLGRLTGTEEEVMDQAIRIQLGL